MINIAELLKNATKGMTLYSLVHGKVEFEEVMDTDYMPIRVMKRGYGLRFDEYGRYMGNEYPDSECILFPSKDCRTWEGWTVEPKFNVGDWIVRGRGFVYEPSLITEIRDYYICELLNGERVTYTLNDVHKNFHLWTIADARDGDVLTDDKKIVIFSKVEEPTRKQHMAYAGLDLCGKLQITKDTKDSWRLAVDRIRPANKKERDLLHEKMREAGYLWDAEKKELRKIFEPQFKVGDDIKTGDTIDTIAEIDYATRSYLCKSGRTIWFENQDLWRLAPKPHYDIANFHAGMPVLVRDYFDEEWHYVQFSHMRKLTHALVFNAGCSDWYQCIPFNGDTKHLLGTSDPCDKCYINW